MTAKQTLDKFFANGDTVVRFTKAGSWIKKLKFLPLLASLAMAACSTTPIQSDYSVASLQGSTPIVGLYASDATYRRISYIAPHLSEWAGTPVLVLTDRDINSIFDSKSSRKKQIKRLLKEMPGFPLRNLDQVPVLDKMLEYVQNGHAAAAPVYPEESKSGTNSNADFLGFDLLADLMKRKEKIGCLVSIQNDIKPLSHSLAQFSGISVQDIRNLPVSQQDWETFVLAHEVYGHCNKNNNIGIFSSRVTGETFADQAAINALFEIPGLYQDPNIINVVIALRATSTILRPFSEPGNAHETSAQLRPEHMPDSEPLTGKQQTALREVIEKTRYGIYSQLPLARNPKWHAVSLDLNKAQDMMNEIYRAFPDDTSRTIVSDARNIMYGGDISKAMDILTKKAHPQMKRYLKVLYNQASYYGRTHDVAQATQKAMSSGALGRQTDPAYRLAQQALQGFAMLSPHIVDMSLAAATQVRPVFDRHNTVAKQVPAASTLQDKPSNKANGYRLNQPTAQEIFEEQMRKQQEYVNQRRRAQGLPIPGERTTSQARPTVKSSQHSR